ncbi:L-aspartate oxidase [Herbiconiux daphne]|uniref:L-aspartate oxidase n=1 Tax=Herbiconiux daphne TaxID=2970914 RepID=A0ABT2H7N3_9MICO|nr:L-aspartate oxidase [Herbiconiux daphne]MCS5735937.1 L-aspartate oxidase [Herbiconiux daphne]
MSSAVRRMSIVIVGSGVAGLVTALALGDRHDVTVVTKSTIDEGNTRYAQGGIAAAVMPGDSVESHIADTLVAGAGLSDPEAVRVLCTEGPDRIRDLIRWGVEFDRENGDPDAGFDAGLEGAHSFHRILHAGGDATGYEVERALVRAVRGTAARVLEQAFVVDLVVGGRAGAGTGGAPAVTGVTVLRDGVLETIAADAVVLASGGIGQLYPHTTNPSVTTGDGAAAALRAGAVLADVEFVQFHPTALAVPGSFLVSEAVRGDGAVLRNSRGERFMLHEHPLAELAPRDIVARAIAAEMTATGAPVLLDATALGADELERRFPTISAASREHGFDWSREPVPVAPAAHYWMGGVATDLDARTSVAGLFAVGEVSCTGVHGANRLASNSLLESLVFAHRAAAAIDADAQISADAGDGSDAGVGSRPWRGLANSQPLTPAPRGDATETDPVTTEPTRAELHAVLWQSAGVHRDADGLRAARATLAGWHIPVDPVQPVDPGDLATGIERLETANLLQLARVLVDAALAREESRGAHYRADHPQADAAFAHHLTVAASETPRIAARERAVARAAIQSTAIRPAAIPPAAVTPAAIHLPAVAPAAIRPAAAPPAAVQPAAAAAATTHQKVTASA